MSQTSIGVLRKPFFRRLPNPMYLRMLGYAATLVIYCTTLVSMTKRYSGAMLQDPDVAYFVKYQFRLLTVWNFLTQLGYAALGLSCDVMTLTREGKASGLLKTLKSFRDVLFSAIVFPISMGVVIIFWSLYLYEPTVVLPPGVVKVLLPIENFIIHTFVLPVSLWEVSCRPRKSPKSHLLNWALIALYSASFVAVLMKTYYETGQFIYPIFDRTWGTPLFSMFIGACTMCFYVFYKIQWNLTEFLWNKRPEAKKIQ